MNCKIELVKSDIFYAKKEICWCRFVNVHKLNEDSSSFDSLPSRQAGAEDDTAGCNSVKLISLL
jgi:hypothetical protein